MLNEQIKKLRIAKGLNQVQMANQLGITKQCVSNWENNNIQPSVDMLIKLTSFFNVSSDYLLGLDNRKYIEVSGLTDEQLTHIQSIVNDLKQCNSKL
ncbi:MAG: helix-turn-helix domain-containing protein [Eubacterium sp.]